MTFVPDLQGVRATLQRIFIVPVLYLMLATLPLFLNVWHTGDRISDKATDIFRNRDNTFDFIVVGSGSAGAIVANRLSKHFTVLLLEAGGEINPLQNVPGFAQFLVNNPQIDWMYRSVPQRRSCLNSVNQQSSWSAGKSLGGSGSLNFMIHLRGHSRDFDRWAAITSDNSWSYNSVLPYFRRHEDFRGPTTDPSAKGTGGDLRIEYPDYKGMAQQWLHAGEELGYPSVDLNGEFAEGFAVNTAPILQGVRQATYRAFIQPIRRRTNLTIRKFATVNRVIFRDMSNAAYGVEYERHGRTHIAIASKEVIISAGAISSPKILMLSGVGPRKHLQDNGIPLRVNLPVGQNLQDHLAVYLGPFTVDPTNSILIDRDLTPTAGVKWVLNGGGILSTAGAQANALVTSSFAKSRGEADWPDMHLILAGVGGQRTFARDFSKAFNLQEDEMRTYYDPVIGQDVFHIFIDAARPVARGEILLSGRNPKEPPIIDPRYLEDPEDLDLRVMMEGVHLGLQIVENTTAFQKIGAKFTTLKLPGCENHQFRSDAYWKCYVKRFSVTLHHPVGTCAMGREEDITSVVDSELRVIGTRNLRVIDASVQPTLVTTNTAASTMMIGEKGADMILKYWGIPEGSEARGPPNNNPFETIFGGNGKSMMENFLDIAGGKNGNPLANLFQLKGNNNFKRDSGVQGNITTVGINNRSGNVNPNSGEENIVNIPNPLDNLITVIAGRSDVDVPDVRSDVVTMLQNLDDGSMIGDKTSITKKPGDGSNSNENIAKLNAAISNLVGNDSKAKKENDNNSNSVSNLSFQNTANKNANKSPLEILFGGNANTNDNLNNIFGTMFSTNTKINSDNNAPKNILDSFLSPPKTSQQKNMFQTIFPIFPNNNNQPKNYFENLFSPPKQQDQPKNFLENLFSPPSDNKQKNVLENIFSSPQQDKPKNILDNLFSSPQQDKPQNILNNLFSSPQQDKPKNILDNLFSPPSDNKPKNILDNLFSPTTARPKNLLDNLFSPTTEKPRNILDDIFSPTTEKPRNILDNLFSPTTERPKNALENLFTPQRESKQNTFLENLFPQQNNINNQPNIFSNLFGGGNQNQNNKNPPKNPPNIFDHIAGKFSGNNNNNKNINPFSFLFGENKNTNQGNPFDVLFEKEKTPTSNNALETLLERITGSADRNNNQPNLFDILFGRNSGGGMSLSPFDVLFGRQSFIQGFFKGLFNNNLNNNNNNNIIPKNDIKNNIIDVRRSVPKNPLAGLFGANKNSSGLNIFEIFGRK